MLFWLLISSFKFLSADITFYQIKIKLLTRWSNCWSSCWSIAHFFICFLFIYFGFLQDCLDDKDCHIIPYLMTVLSWLTTDKILTPLNPCENSLTFQDLKLFKCQTRLFINVFILPGWQGKTWSQPQHNLNCGLFTWSLELYQIVVTATCC